ncbi:bifunctional DNA primase/polymerase [Actinoplanes sp. N902-109]|uniref:bifunctional DNA primase/polymerase n=1 Tax=Actinoplanes sp. (strain N902-109) TaxID=649831 RepID=UPI0003295754|nr:bifunctional DNA primase/polymerase [Actinoplanes sp. N902-109]AGL15305.1 bifunctional DNA primase/polymerase [Actinoplanes sp. N902-109]
MQWSTSLIDRIRLRRAAQRYAMHGWAVTPGAYPTGGRFTCGRAGCRIMGCHPAVESWEDDASTDVARVAGWWRQHPYTVLLATGSGFDVLEVPAAVGLRVLGAVRLHTGVIGPEQGDARGPVAVTPSGRWMFFVLPDGELRPELASCLDILHHGRGSWIPAAPSRTPEGPVRWAVAPEQIGWHLPGSATVQAMLLDALDALGRRPPRPVALSVPRQMSTARRAA